MTHPLDTAAARDRKAHGLAATAREHLRAAVLAALAEGMSESEAARRAGVTRMTVRAWRADAQGARRGGHMSDTYLISAESASR